MIQEILNKKHHLALTSDRWHVLRARWTGNRAGEPLFERTIISEHTDSATAATAGRELLHSFRPEMSSRTDTTRDQVLVRKPGYLSLKIAKQAKKRPA